MQTLNDMKHIIALLLALQICACASSINGSNYLDMSPEFNLPQFFDGQVKAWGIVQNRAGDVVQRFIVDIDASNNGNTTVLDETFEYAVGDGVKQRTWTITEESPGVYTGKASDIIGVAQAQTFGNALRWQYQMDLPVGDKEYRVSFDDWMWLFNEETLMNRSYIRKFGLVMAEVTIFMQQQ